MDFEKKIRKLEKEIEKEERIGGCGAEMLAAIYNDEIIQLQKERRRIKNAETRKRKAEEIGGKDKRKDKRGSKRSSKIT
jgi:hypothetical protein